MRIFKGLESKWAYTIAKSFKTKFNVSTHAFDGPLASMNAIQCVFRPYVIVYHWTNIQCYEPTDYDANAYRVETLNFFFLNVKLGRALHKYIDHWPNIHSAEYELLMSTNSSNTPRPKRKRNKTKHKKKTSKIKHSKSIWLMCDVWYARWVRWVRSVFVLTNTGLCVLACSEQQISNYENKTKRKHQIELTMMHILQWFFFSSTKNDYYLKWMLFSVSM